MLNLTETQIDTLKKVFDKFYVTHIKQVRKYKNYNKIKGQRNYHLIRKIDTINEMEALFKNDFVVLIKSDNRHVSPYLIKTYILL